MEDKLIKISEAAKLMGVSINSLRNWDQAGTFKSVPTPGGHRRYRLSDIEKFQKGEYESSKDN